MPRNLSFDITALAPATLGRYQSCQSSDPMSHIHRLTHICQLDPARQHNSHLVQWLAAASPPRLFPSLVQGFTLLFPLPTAPEGQKTEEGLRQRDSKKALLAHKRGTDISTPTQTATPPKHATISRPSLLHQPLSQGDDSLHSPFTGRRMGQGKPWFPQTCRQTGQYLCLGSLGLRHS